MRLSRIRSTMFSLSLTIICLTFFTCNGFCVASANKQQQQSSYSSPSALTSIPIGNTHQHHPFDQKEFHKTKTEIPNITNLYSRVTFSWVKELMHIGNKKVLELKDVWKLPTKFQMKTTSATFQELMEKEKKKAKDAVSSGLTANHLASGSPTSSSSSSSASSSPNILMEFWNSPITKSIIYMYKEEFLQSALVRLINTFIQFLPSLIVARILRNLQKEPITLTTFPNLLKEIQKNKSFQLSILLFFCLSIKTVIENQYFDMVTNLGAQIRGTLSAAIYQKSLKLGVNSRQNSTLGELVNYMQIDTGRLEYVAASIHTVWDGLLQIVGYTTLLLYFLGPSVLAGIAAMLLIIPLNGYFLTKLSQVRESNLKYTDIRVKLTNEIFQGIRAIKSYNWEKPFLKKLQDARDKELKLLKAAANSRSFLIAALGAAPSFVAVFSLTTYALLGNKVDPTNVFTSLALFNQLRFPLTFFPLLLSSLAEGRISLKRLTKFLLQEEIEDYVEKDFSNTSIMDNEDGNALSGGGKKPAIYVSNATFSWSSTQSQLLKIPAVDRNHTSAPINRGILTNVSLAIKPGELVAVIGPIGSGKSTLLNAFLGELTKQEGKVVLQGEVAYVPQTSWIPNDSLRHAILFGKEMNWRNYRKSIRVSGLNKDLELLQNGDLTEIGEKGVNLSGGQRQRISIARAVYQDADIYLFDDPLSALDSQVGQKVFQDCIQVALKGKTRILVTHKLSVLAEVDKIILMDVNSSDNGSVCRILDQGTLWQLILRGHDLSRYVKRTNEEAADPKEDSLASGNAEENITAKLSLNIPEEELKVEGVTTASAPPAADTTSIPVDALHMSPAVDTTLPATTSNDIAVSITTDDEDSPFVNDGVMRQMTVEERGEGAVSFEYYKRYILQAKKPWLLLLILFSYVLANGSQVLQQYIVAAWTNDINYRKRPLATYLVGVALMATAVGGFNYLRAYISAMVGAASSKAIHNQMISKMLKAPLNYFESTPIGRLLQRFSKDLDQIDNQLPNSMGQLIASSLQIASSVAAICTVTPTFGIYMGAIFTIYFSITNYYRPVARELKRLDSLSRSPIYSHFSETLSGLSVIRSYHRNRLYQRINEAKLDDNLSAYFALKSIDRWLSFRLETLGNIIVLFASLLVVFTGSKAGAAGLSLTNALGITGLLNWAVRNAAETESLMNSVERVYYTIDETPEEGVSQVAQYSEDVSCQNATLALFPSRPNADHSNIPADQNTAQVSLVSRYSSDQELLVSGWPWKGELVFSNVTMKYRDDFENVLKGVDFTIRAGEKIGIVGRTGSGKSSLFRGLLRLNELEAGKITLDQVDISKIGLDTLRSQISIIPQDPILFSGSIRMNIDPFHTSTDEEIWSALYKSKLYYVVKSLPGELDYEVSESGDNFSSGQKQLLCLTRALIRKSKVLLLDEATSSVDYYTDSMIQETINKEFDHHSPHKTTILTIAHRLSTVMNSDKILVMENGIVKEFDSPVNLLLNPQSLFYQLVLAERNEATMDGSSLPVSSNHHQAVRVMPSKINSSLSGKKSSGKKDGSNNGSSVDEEAEDLEDSLQVNLLMSDSAESATSATSESVSTDTSSGLLAAQMEDTSSSVTSQIEDASSLTAADSSYGGNMEETGGLSTIPTEISSDPSSPMIESTPSLEIAGDSSGLSFVDIASSPGPSSPPFEQIDSPEIM